MAISLPFYLQNLQYMMNNFRSTVGSIGANPQGPVDPSDAFNPLNDPQVQIFGGPGVRSIPTPYSGARVQTPTNPSGGGAVFNNQPGGTFPLDYPSSFGNYAPLPGEISAGPPINSFDPNTGQPIYNPRGYIPSGNSYSPPWDLASGNGATSFGGGPNPFGSNPGVRLR